MDVQYELAVEELKEASNPAEKQMLLQKYGLIDPKLTSYEKNLIILEATIGEMPLGYSHISLDGEELHERTA